MTRSFLNTARTNGKRKRRQHERGYLRTFRHDLRRTGGSLFHLLFILCRVGREYVENHPKKITNAPFLASLALFFIPKSLSQGEIFKNFLGR